MYGLKAVPFRENELFRIVFGPVKGTGYLAAASFSPYVSG
jgi:hypothetical protein